MTVLKIGDKIEVMSKDSNNGKVGEIVSLYHDTPNKYWVKLVSYPCHFAYNNFELKCLNNKEEKMEFKIGDIVRVVSSNMYSFCDEFIGHIGEVSCINGANSSLIYVKFSPNDGITDYVYQDYDLELVNPEPKKPDIKKVSLEDHRKVVEATEEYDETIVVKKTRIVKHQDKYPVLMRNTTDPYIVLFHNESMGVVVESTYHFYKVGYYSDKWLMERFKECNDEILLTNK